MRSYIKSRKTHKGPATITVLTKNVRIEMDITDGGRTTHQVFEVAREDAPADVRSGQFHATVNEEKTKLFRIGPMGSKGPDGKVIPMYAVFDGLAHIEGQPLLPRNSEGREWSFTGKGGSIQKRIDPPSRTFTANYRVVSGPYAGLVAPFILHYLFEQDEDYGDGNEAMIYVDTSEEPWPQWARTLKTMLQVSGFNDAVDSLPYSQDGEETLEAIDRLLKERNQLVRAFISPSGYVNRVGPAEEGLTVESFAKKPAKTTKKAK